MIRFLCYRLIFATLLLFWSYAAIAASRSVIACAIRWDAWYTNGPNDPGYYTALALSKPEWHARAPLHAKFDPFGKIIWAPSQATFDAEIRAARGANLCWAYLAYGKSHMIDLKHPMMKGLAFHRNSAIKTEVKYALIIQARLLGVENNYRDAVNAIIQLMRDDNYQHISLQGASRPCCISCTILATSRLTLAGRWRKSKNLSTAFGEPVSNKVWATPILLFSRDLLAKPKLYEKPRMPTPFLNTSLGGEMVASCRGRNSSLPLKQTGTNTPQPHLPMSYQRSAAGPISAHGARRRRRLIIVFRRTTNAKTLPSILPMKSYSASLKMRYHG